MVVTSYLQNNSSRQLFLKRHRDILKQVVSILLALVLFVIDTHRPHNPLRYYLGHLSSGLQIVLTRPMVWADDLHEFFFGQHYLQEENQALMQQLANLQAQLQQKNLQLDKYQELKQWRDFHDPKLQFAESANLLFLQVNPSRQIYVLDKGRRNQVFEGQVAIDGQGLIGQIIDVGEYTASLMLISDAKSGVPVINKRNGEHGIVVGTNHHGLLQLLNIPKTDSVQVGDLLVTSGLGLVYPYGIPVGQVQSVTTVPGEDFLAVEVSPKAKLNQHQMVILLKNSEISRHWKTEVQQHLTMVEEQQAS